MNIRIRLTTPALLIAAWCMLPPAARSQPACPDGSPCVTSVTSLVPGDNNLMDVYTTVSQDIPSSAFYGLCLNLDVLQVDPSNPNDSPNGKRWPIIVPSTTPDYCQIQPGTVSIGSDTISGPIAWVTFAATPGVQYFAFGVAKQAILAPDCQDCDTWTDYYGFSSLAMIENPDPGDAGIGYSWPAIVGTLQWVVQIISENSSGAYATAPEPWGSPQILFTDTSVPNGSTIDVTDNATSGLGPVSVLVGQQIVLAGAVNDLPPGVTLQSSSWSASGNVVGGYVASTKGGGTVVTLPSSGSCQNLIDQPCLTFYWVASGPSGSASQTVTYLYTLSNNPTQGYQAVATFTVLGPSNVSVAIAQSPVTVLPPGSNPDLLLYTTVVNGNVGVAGAKFVASAAFPPGHQGTYQWVQLLDQADGPGSPVDPLRWNSKGQKVGETCYTYTDPQVLDNVYPYAATQTTVVPNDTAVDSPTEAVSATDAEVARYFGATIYNMWDPTLPSGCVSGTNCSSIPVPLGTVTWQFSCDAINTLANQANATTWTLNSQPNGTAAPSACPAPSNGGFHAPSSFPQSFPQWTHVALPTDKQPCH